MIQVNTGECLKTDLTPGGILSLEFAWQRDYANALRTEWQKPCEVQKLPLLPVQFAKTIQMQRYYLERRQF